jgi:K+-transporting ATPase ATPase C chain
MQEVSQGVYNPASAIQERKHMSDLISSLRLSVLSILVCSGGYSAVMLGFASLAASEARQGSMVRSQDGTIVGSRLIAQSFTRPEYFWPRPSACGYNASATGGSNWGPTNPLLRDRIARQLGPMVTYAAEDKKGQPVGPDIERWFQEQPLDFVAHWATEHSALAEKWIKDHAAGVAAFLDVSVDDVAANSGEMAKNFFAQFAQKHPGAWPVEEETTTSEGQTAKQIKPVHEGADVQAYLFDLWLHDHHGVELEKVPADLVLASGAGMDPHITLAAALFQAPRVAAARNISVEQVESLIQESTDAPTLAAFGSEPVVNVLALNVALDAHGDSGD